ncbi:6-bladed beta-propeller [Halosquirtibacter xylanolyticus]|uniref:6-bladed beta-propeller n=1 Tax=Halosquirtibacter xylanolyticus TaxID=3374599 RepID=UPI00374A3332|nr:6-bladed beta-propeller [Prolixibacteraceae bacterium]
MKKKSLFSIVLFLCVVGCKRAPSPDAFQGKVLECEKKELFDMTSLVDHIEFVKLEQNKKSIFGFGTTIKYKNGFYYAANVVNAGKVLVFDSKGKFIRKIGRKGRGPGEFIKSRAFDVDDLGNVYIVDGYKFKVVKYDHKNKFISEAKMDFFGKGFRVLSDDKFVFLANKRQSEYQILVTDHQCNILKRYFKYPKEYNDKHLDFCRFSNAKDGVNYIHRQNQEIYNITSDGDLVPLYKLDFGCHTLSDEYRNNPGKLISVDRNKKLSQMHFCKYDILLGETCIYGTYNNTETKKNRFFRYDLDKNKMYADLRSNSGKIDLRQIVIPSQLYNDSILFSNVSYETFKKCNNKELLPDSLVPHLKSGGTILIKHILKK